MKKPWMALIVALVAAAFAVAFVACDGSSDDDDDEPTVAPEETMAEPAAEIPAVDITGTEYTFEAPASVAGGLTQVNFTNAGVEAHQATFFRLNDGVTFEDFTAAGIQGENDAAELGVWAGGPGASPGGDNSNVLELSAGEYVVLCVIPDAEGVPHFVSGMITPMEVTEAPAEQPEPPVADVSVSMSEFAYDAPATLPAGETTFEAINDGEQVHEMAILQPAEGLTVEDLLGILSAPPDPEAPPPEGPPPFGLPGQVAAISPGGSAFSTIDLAPGSYVYICFVTDPETEAPHFLLDMWLELTVE